MEEGAEEARPLSLPGQDPQEQARNMLLASSQQRRSWPLRCMLGAMVITALVCAAPLARPLLKVGGGRGAKSSSQPVELEEEGLVAKLPDAFRQVKGSVLQAGEAVEGGAHAGEEVAEEALKGTAGAFAAKLSNAAAGGSDVGSDVGLVEKTEEPAEWVVNGHFVRVRAEKSLTSRINGHMYHGQICIGQREGGWVKLLYGKYHGFMKIHVNYYPGSKRIIDLVRKREAQYKEVVGGTCLHNGQHPILDPHVCAFAHKTLGIRGEVHVAKASDLPAPQGCYVARAQSSQATPFFSSLLASAGHAPQKDQACICSSQPYPNYALTPDRSKWSYPSLFCWEVTRLAGYERGIVQSQWGSKSSIFACDEWLLLSGDKAMMLAPGLKTVGLGNIQCGVAWWGSWYNTQVFVRAWQAVLNDRRYLRHDWTVKVDPDAVWWPSRLKQHILQSGLGRDSTAYFKNAFGANDLLGPIEVFSRKAVMRYAQSKDSACLVGNLGVSGEDGWINGCMQNLGVLAHFDGGLLDNTGHACTNGGTVCYHAHKDAGSWNGCLMQGGWR